MPLIKDKDRYKKLTRRDSLSTNRQDYPNKSINKDLRKKQQDVDNKRSDVLLTSTLPKLNFAKPKGGEVTHILTLKPGQSLLNLTVCNKESSPAFDLHWSFDSPDKLTFTVGSGVITDVTGGTTIRLMADTMSALETVSMASVLSSMLTGGGARTVTKSFEPPSSMFANVEKTIYFYMSVSASTIDVTYAIHS